MSADARADFEKAMRRYGAAKKSGGHSAMECDSVSDAFKKVADENPGLLEARFNQGAVLAGVRARGRRRAKSGRGMVKYGPAIANSATWPGSGASRNEAESDVQPRDRGQSAPHRRGP